MELQHYTLELPTITFDKSYVIRDKAHDLHLEFRGHAHTAGDVVTFCPQKQVISTGDAIHGTLLFIADGFRKRGRRRLMLLRSLALSILCRATVRFKPAVLR